MRGKIYFIQRPTQSIWQIPLDEDSKEKTAFAVPGLFHFCLLPFGHVIQLKRNKDKWMPFLGQN